MITRQVIEAELDDFLVDLADCVERVYGVETAETLKRNRHRSPLWEATMRTFEYAVEGIAHYGEERALARDVFSAIHFFEGLVAFGHGLNFGDFAVPRMPQKVFDMVELANSRNLLDGNQHFLIFGHGEDEEGSDIPPGFLSVGDVARLADMDVKSVRNATGPRAADRLITQSSGKSTWVAIDEARRWLAGRKGFNPTRMPGDVAMRAPSLLFLASDVVQELQARAAQEGESVEALLRQMLFKERA